MRVNRDVKQLSRKFGVLAKRVVIVKNGVYRITTAGGVDYCLKRMPNPPVQLGWIDKTLQRMRRKGSIQLGWRNLRAHPNKRLFAKLQQASSPFILIPWIKGAWPSSASKRQMRECGILLAKFHKAGAQINVPAVGKRNMLGSWPSLLRTDHRKLLVLIRKARRNGFNSPLDHMLQTHGRELLNMAGNSIQALRASRYRSLCRKTRPTLCHGDFGPTNVIRTRIVNSIIDFETLGLDLRAYDLYRAIYNFCQCLNWNFSVARSFLDGYQTISKLKREDYEMMKVLLRFPRGICRLIDHYDYRTAKGKHRIERDFTRILLHERRRAAFLRKLDAYAGIRR
ncbi:CotS family spore coat protein [Paenibacillus castaneae]|uniref:phosphotransferase n=1 Tax=Paenibacillus castaneae TaxID=474957 RepID=UPI000C9A96C4|nr:phosphotransferase [Paenibacillus castaneae]NIK75371.1 CotS family spore coat protein [Paenibacillus castaneae]